MPFAQAATSREAAETRRVKRQDARDAKTLEEPAKELDEHVSELLATAIEVHRILGPGFIPSRLTWRPGVLALNERHSC